MVERACENKKRGRKKRGIVLVVERVGGERGGRGKDGKELVGWWWSQKVKTRKKKKQFWSISFSFPQPTPSK